VEYTYALLDAGDYEKLLEITQQVLDRVHDSSLLQKLYDDDPTGINWILDNHARALVALGKWTQAEWDYRSAADRLEHGHRNVSNVINLASFEADLGRGDEALKVLNDFPGDGPDLGPYGRMQWYAVQLAAAVAQSDEVLVEQSLKYLAAHQEDAPSTYQAALLRAGRTEEAAQLMIRRLAASSWRPAALRDLQIYRDPPALPQAQREADGWRALRKRNDVRAAVERVGRIMEVPLPSPVM
jgi:tetratricopeptide (TPR) repeat protein